MVENLLPGCHPLVRRQSVDLPQLAHPLHVPQEVPAADLQSGSAHPQLRVGARLREDLLDLVPVELSVVVAQLGCFEVLEQQVANLRADCSEAAAEVLVALVVCGDVERGCVTVVEVVEVGVEVGHVVYHQTGQLSAGCLDCRLAVVQHSEVRSAEGSVLVLLLDERDLDALRKESQLSPHSCCQLLHQLSFTSLLGSETKISKCSWLIVLICSLLRKSLSPFLNDLNEKLTLSTLFPASR